MLSGNAIPNHTEMFGIGPDNPDEPHRIVRCTFEYGLVAHSTAAPSQKQRLVRGCKTYTPIEMKKAEHDEQLKIPTIGFVFANSTHVRRFVQPASEHQAL